MFRRDGFHIIEWDLKQHPTPSTVKMEAVTSPPKYNAMTICIGKNNTDYADSAKIGSRQMMRLLYRLSVSDHALFMRQHKYKHRLQKGPES